MQIILLGVLNMTIYENLFEKLKNGLLKYTMNIGDAVMDGGFICPACRKIHGRDDNAIYPFMFEAARTNDSKYLDHARKLFVQQAENFCPDGSMVNGRNSSWRGITAFSALGLGQALTDYGYMLEPDERKAWEDRFRKMVEWLIVNIDTSYPANINYRAGNAACLIVAGQYFNEERYLSAADVLAKDMMNHLTENGLIFGEGVPNDGTTKKGCRPIDLGYNFEETLSLLAIYAEKKKSKEYDKQLIDVLKAHLWFVNPDGSIDNSTGTRNYKWTYWGSRTADGCSEAFGVFGKAVPELSEASARNTKLILDCLSDDGLIYGGKEYKKYNEPPCIHHTFCHFAGLVAAVKNKIDAPANKVLLPIEKLDGAKYFKELDTYRIHKHGYYATITGYDYEIQKGHTSGGSISYLYSEDKGVILVSTMVDYRMLEAGNMQLSIMACERQGSLSPRIELVKDGIKYSNVYNPNAEMSLKEEGDNLIISVKSELVTIDGKSFEEKAAVDLEYMFSGQGFKISATVPDNPDIYFYLPVVSEKATVSSQNNCISNRTVFNLAGGFGANEYKFEQQNGKFDLIIK